MNSKSGKIRVFLSGMIMLLVTLFAAIASIVFNMATSTSNAELILNAAVLLFINEVDEKVYSIFQVLFDDWNDKVFQGVVTTIDEDFKDCPQGKCEDSST